MSCCWLFEVLLFLNFILQVDNENYKAQFLRTNDEGKILEISDLKAFTRYSVVIIAFTGDVNAAAIEGKASSPVIVSTFEAGVYFSLIYMNQCLHFFPSSHKWQF